MQRPPDARFPLGYGKVEAVGTLAVSGLLLSGAAVIGINSALDVWAILVAPMGDATAAVTANSTVSSLKVGSDHHHQHGAGVSNPEIAAIVAVGSITVKEWLYRASKCMGTCRVANPVSHESRQGAKLQRPRR